ncbi:MAG: hypothetical protein PHQ91_04960 [Thermoanaerobaculaceae bacterium]|nr:hypothetical protein [Thermoanaerobaculaceae bacterium]TAM46011.1 MAG: hypothetical protein EPN53_14045 [Acidobacteriota bacterium]
MRGVVRIAAFAVAAAIVSGVPALGAGLEAGTRELSFSGTFESVSGSGNMLQLTAELGFMLTEHDEVGPTLGLYQFSVGSDSLTGGSFGAFYRYNFVTKAPAQVPFVGFRFERALGDYDLFRDRAEADAGVRLLPVPSVAVNITAFYRRSTSQYAGAARNSAGMALGISFFL